MKKICAILAAAAAGLSAVMSSIPVIYADNPIVQTNYTADPAPMIHDDTFYVYTSHDLDGSTYFTMPDWKCYSTTDMQNWTDHGSVLSYADFSWAEENTAWAAQCIERNGRFYFYVTLVPAETGGRAIGVAVADSPEGPFKDALGKPLIGPNWDYIDPTVFIDDDGQAYLYFGNPTLNYVKLNEDMISYSGEVSQIQLTAEGFGSRPDGDERHPTLYEEGPWFYRRGDLYYMVYAASGIPENICYSTSPTPTGPWTFRGEIMASGGGSFTNHSGIVDYRGHSYFAYHTGQLPGGGGFTRSVCIEEFTYQEDGLIPKIPQTKEGPAQLEAVNPYLRNEAEKICWESGIETEVCSAGGMNIANIEKGDYVKIKGVDFGDGAEKFTASVASAEKGGVIEVHMDSTTGPIIGVCNVPATGGWQNWQEVSCDSVGASGEHDLYLVFSGGDGFLFNVDWWKFTETGGGLTEEGYYFKSTFESGEDGWNSRGGASVQSTKDTAYQGESALYVDERTASWNGMMKKLSATHFQKGETYSFSAEVMQDTGRIREHVMMKLEYKDGNGDVQYHTIAEADVIRSRWTQLANPTYTIPANASDLHVYLETADGTVSFYADQIIAAPGGTEIAGSGVVQVIKGDLDGDGAVTGFDLAMAKRGMLQSLPDTVTEAAADVDESGVFEMIDLIHMVRFINGSSMSFADEVGFPVL